MPVVLYSAEKRADLHFHLVDSRDSARIRYERVNEETGEEVPWDRIVKVCVLLREAMESSGKVGIAKVVIRARQYLAALMSREDSLMLELLRFPQELRDEKEFAFPHEPLTKYKINKKSEEIRTAA